MKKILIGISSLILFFTVLETGSRWWILRYGHALDKTRPIISPDVYLGWRHDPQLETKFLDKSFSTDERGFRIVPHGEGKHILFLGPSSTVGWGVHNEESYPALLARDFKVTNAAQIGHSSFQGLRLYQKELTAEKFDYVIIAFGINDVDMNRFYFQSQLRDAEELQEKKSEAIVLAQKFLFSSSLMSVTHKAVFHLLSTLLPRPSHQMLEEYIQVNEAEFRENFTRMIHEIREKGATPLILSTVTNFTPSSDKEIQFRQELILKRSQRYREILKEVAASERVKIADPEDWFQGSRDKFFVDPVHFSPEGNKVIAEHLRQLLNDKSSHL